MASWSVTSNARRSLVCASTALLVVLGWAVARASQSTTDHFADADDLALVEAGKPLYMHWCASCHGRRLQGQPLWQLADEYAGRRAPAHDETGHTWRHSDEELFAMTKYGRFPLATQGTSSMPTFEGRLSDQDILATLAFIKARWPLGLRVSQAMLNPDYAGMPAGADQVEWTLPPTCTGSNQRWRAGPR
ncbi:MAG TPA: c-type cytochrome [Burkholderiales bacterium]|nr:c-type cytochrome [Burkholderiales bacterium]